MRGFGSTRGVGSTSVQSYQSGRLMVGSDQAQWMRHGYLGMAGCRVICAFHRFFPSFAMALYPLKLPTGNTIPRIVTRCPSPTLVRSLWAH